MRSEPTLEGTGGIEGVLPAEQLWFDSGGRLAYERCARPHCARAIAAKAEALVRASAMGPADGASGATIMAKLCPSIELDATHAHAPSEAIAALAANAPCKWRPVPIEDLQPIPGVGAPHAGADRHRGARAAPGAVGDPARPTLIGARRRGGG